jgi:hypothetical protein
MSLGPSDRRDLEAVAQYAQWLKQPRAFKRPFEMISAEQKQAIERLNFKARVRSLS